MKKIVLCVLLLIVIAFSYQPVEAKVCKNGNFSFKYKTIGDGVWLYNITPLSDKGIETLNIPKTLGGKKVVKMAGMRDDEDGGSDIFGIYNQQDGEGLEPKNIYKRLKKIKTIRIPESVETISDGCFKYTPNIEEKTINIPKSANELSVLRLWGNWRKITISPKNKYYKVVDECLISKKTKYYMVFPMGKRK